MTFCKEEMVQMHSDTARKNGGVKDEGVEMRIVCLCESDRSLHLPLSSRRTNYKVMDSRLISRATSGFKLAGLWCRTWCDGEELGVTWVLREDGDVEKEKDVELKTFIIGASSPLFIFLLLSSVIFSFGCVWI